MNTMTDIVIERIADRIMGKLFNAEYQAKTPEYVEQASAMTKLFRYAIRKEIIDILHEEIA